MTTLLRGGTIITGAGQRRADLLLDGEKIAWVGRGPQAADREVDVSGCFLFPGFIDAHSHLVQFANNLQYASLTGADSLDEIARRLREFVRKNNIAPGTPVIGTGYDHNDLPGRAHPTRQF